VVDGPKIITRSKFSSPGRNGRALFLVYFKYHLHAEV
jgi:hypothetical protein